MGLEERRKLQELQTKSIPGRSAELARLCGSETLTYDVDWDTFAEDAGALKFLDNVACHRVNCAIRMLCKDELGKQAVCDSIQSVKITNVADVADKRIDFAEGVLKIHGAYAKGLSGAFNEHEIQRFLSERI